MLDGRGVAHRFRDYSRDPLGPDELRALVRDLGMEPHEVLRRKDRAFRELGLQGNEAPETLLAHMADHPGLLVRPIGVKQGRAVVGRPIERLLEL